MYLEAQKQLKARVSVSSLGVHKSINLTMVDGCGFVLLVQDWEEVVKGLVYYYDLLGDVHIILNDDSSLDLKNT